MCAGFAARILLIISDSGVASEWNTILKNIRFYPLYDAETGVSGLTEKSPEKQKQVNSLKSL
jgi:hypothetical protein